MHKFFEFLNHECSLAVLEAVRKKIRHWIFWETNVLFNFKAFYHLMYFFKYKKNFCFWSIEIQLFVNTSFWKILLQRFFQYTKIFTWSKRATMYHTYRSWFLLTSSERSAEGVREAFVSPGFWNLTFSYETFSKKGCFLVSSGWNEISPLFGSLGKIHYRPPLEKILPTSMTAAHVRLCTTQSYTSYSCFPRALRHEFESFSLNAKSHKFITQKVFVAFQASFRRDRCTARFTKATRCVVWQ